MGHLRAKMPAMMGKQKAQDKLLRNLSDHFSLVQREHHLPIGKLSAISETCIPDLSTKLIQSLCTAYETYSWTAVAAVILDLNCFITDHKPSFVPLIRDIIHAVIKNGQGVLIQLSAQKGGLTMASISKPHKVLEEKFWLTKYWSGLQVTSQMWTDTEKFWVHMISATSPNWGTRMWRPLMMRFPLTSLPWCANLTILTISLKNAYCLARVEHWHSVRLQSCVQHSLKTGVNICNYKVYLKRYVGHQSNWPLRNCNCAKCSVNLVAFEDKLLSIPN